LFGEYGLEDVAEDEYYDGARISDAFFDVVDEVGEKTMEKGGEQMGRDVPWPPEVDGPHDGLAAIDEIHRAAAREKPGAPSGLDRPMGGYTYERIGDRSARVGIRENYPYPTVMARGVFAGIVDGLGGGNATLSEEPAGDGEIAAWTVEW
jgi:hypothetical protein